MHFNRHAVTNLHFKWAEAEQWQFYYDFVLLVLVLAILKVLVHKKSTQVVHERVSNKFYDHNNVVVNLTSVQEET